MIYPSQLTLGKNEYHLWYTSPGVIKDKSLLALYYPLLSEEESKKQQRFVFEEDRHDALVTRAFVRDLLSRYTGKSPDSLTFHKGEKGKPELVNSELPLRFNLSHTKELIICSVCLDDDIGCDVESLERKNDVLPIADRFFSEKEVSDLFTLPIEQQKDRFFDYWTLKESYIKAWGGGLSIPLGDFSFSIKKLPDSRINNQITLSFSNNRKDCAAHWQSWLLRPNNKHRIAVSIRKPEMEQANTKQKIDYGIRYFESVPLNSVKEVNFINL